VRSDLIDIEARLVRETEKAWLLDVGGDESVWVPKSVAEFDGETVTLPERMAQEKGMI
jgi:hypothetical protein